MIFSEIKMLNYVNPMRRAVGAVLKRRAVGAVCTDREWKKLKKNNY